MTRPRSMVRVFKSDVLMQDIKLVRKSTLMAYRIVHGQPSIKSLASEEYLIAQVKDPKRTLVVTEDNIFNQFTIVPPENTIFVALSRIQVITQPNLEVYFNLLNGGKCYCRLPFKCKEGEDHVQWYTVEGTYGHLEASMPLKPGLKIIIFADNDQRIETFEEVIDESGIDGRAVKAFNFAFESDIGKPTRYDRATYQFNFVRTAKVDRREHIEMPKQEKLPAITGLDLQRMQYPVVVELWDKLTESSRIKRMYEAKFTADERIIARKFHGLFEKWHLETGTPDSYTFSSFEEFKVMKKLVAFFGEL